MKFLDLFRKNTESTARESAAAGQRIHWGGEILQEKQMQQYLSIAAEISNYDPLVMEEVELCIMQPTHYVARYAQRFALRCLDPVQLSTDVRIWISMADSLMEHGYAAELDWKCTYSDLISALEQLNIWGSIDVALPSRGMESDGDIMTWCGALDYQWKSAGICIGGIDIDSDSYVIFLTSEEQLKFLKECAVKIQHKISYASKL